MAGRVRRLDKRGRPIGYNWWRTYNTDLLLDATLDWERRRDEVCIGYATEEREYQADNPVPNLKAFLLANKGMNREPDGQ